MPPKKAVAKTSKANPRKASAISRPVARAAADTGKKGMAASKAKAQAPAKSKVTKAAPKAAARSTTKAPAKTSAKAPAKASAKTAAKTAAKSGEKPVANQSKKRKTQDEPQEAQASKRRKSQDDDQDLPDPPVKKSRVIPKKPAKAKVILNQALTTRLNVYVFGEGSAGELGLGTVKGAIDVKRPRLNPHLSADTVGVVQIATGGMHVAALTHDNRVLTWGVNDQGALGRDTTWEGGLKDMDAGDDNSDDGDDNGLNPFECTPTAIPSDSFPEGTVIVQLAAADSSTFALTDDGLVYGWGTFRNNEGILGFSATSKVQATPTLVKGLKNITKIAAGANHILALDVKGNVFAWGSGQQNQLGRRVVERTRMNGLTPREFGLPKNKIASIQCGAYHSFAIDKSEKVWSWGLNSYGETGLEDEVGEDEAVILKPKVIESLNGKSITCIEGGAHHSIAVTASGEVLVWGRVDGKQSGIKISDLPSEDIVMDDRDNPRILKKPTAIPGISNATFATAGSDHCIALNAEGLAYSWGFSANYQTGQGTDEDVEVATHIDNTAVRGKVLTWAGAGGQYSIVASAVADQAS